MSDPTPSARALALAEEASFDFAVGDEAAALAKLQAAVTADPACFEAWLAKAEVHFAAGQYDEALAAGEQALALRPKDIHVHTSLSRIWMERGDKTKAEHHGAQARILGWGDQLKEPEGKQPGEL
ncbi:MAG: tetratricopeptide repeat protein [Opitutales bacterium]